jgi:hypothetical protein
MQRTLNSGVSIDPRALDELRGELRRSWRRFGTHAAAALAAVAISVVEIGGILLLPSGPAHAAAGGVEGNSGTQARLIVPEMHAPLL